MADNKHHHLITNLNDQGLSEFLDNVRKPSGQHTPFGFVSTIYGNSSLPPNLTADDDIQETQRYREQGLSANRITVDNGIVASVVQIKPSNLGGSSPMHRTRTLDFGIVVEGEVELTLDSGEIRRLKQGDTVIQRGTMHKWINITPNSGWATMFFVSLDAQEIKAAGAVLGESWGP
ncbi:uncharacterized protein Z520_04693 [Fonsecaea multimorphosa CBS 102226]|uniref:Cupin type-2 domain-containing protein n=1 Tax=Fonsecaea multimorphosa CBS 102226 TaxID=1442371 RepID=A0A0D2JZZ4_9EURO|nr:uncharacterized protein Z520_04693 [Fonsecaea multimorphosa CBS 102226]KIX99117.1 hypothetical protein Z520_04693 [Fonsecaea multimorphosa CBS 102226]OAL26028.1 hypothetical protein AYO22_04442 [Fonsecaea multimorphosa]